MSKLIQFYNNLYPINNKNYFFSDVMKWDDYNLEVKHDYIKWLFPSEKEDKKNPVLTKQDIKQFRSNTIIRSNVVEATLKMLFFYGFVLDGSSYGVKQEKPLNRRDNGRTIGLFAVHNYNRLTRIMDFLVTIDMDYLSAIFFLALCQALKSNELLLKKVIANKSIKYWMATQNYLVSETYNYDTDKLFPQITVSPVKKIENILKIGGGISDELELKADENAVIIGNHTGIMKGVDWSNEMYWNTLHKKMKDTLFKIIIIDKGSTSWIEKSRLPIITEFIKKHITNDGVFIFEQYIYDNIIKYFPKYHKYVIYPKTAFDKNLQFDNFLFLLSKVPIYSNYFISIDSPLELTWQNEKFETAKYRNKIVSSSISQDEIYKLIINLKDKNSDERCDIKGLNYTGNSCYMDSTLLCIFSVYNKIITENILEKDLSALKTIGRNLWSKCDENIDNDIKRRQNIQKVLNNITESMRGLDNVKKCSNLRSLIAKCPGSQPFHGTGTQDAGEFLSYLFNLFQVDVANTRRSSYGSNDLDNNPKWILVSKQKDNYASPIIDVVSTTLKMIPDDYDITQFVKQTQDSILEDSDIWIPDKNNPLVTYTRRKEVFKIQKSRLIIFNLVRTYGEASFSKTKTGRGKFKGIVTKNIWTGISAPETMILNDVKLDLSAIVVHTGSVHYVANFKCNNEWFWYDDNPSSSKHLIKHIGSYDNMLKTKPNPLTHGVLFFYT